MPDTRRPRSAYAAGRAAKAGVGLLALLVLVAGCGTRATRDEVINAAAPGLGAGSGSGTGTSTTGDPQAGGSAAGTTGATATGSTTGVTASGATGSTTGASAAGSATSGAASSTTGTPGTPGTKGTGGATATTGTTGPAAAPAGPANKSPINVGIVGTFSGPVGSLVKDSTTGVRLWASYINDNGGVNGHPVKVLVGDDGGDPAKFNSLVQQFADRDKVVAFINNTLGFAPNGNNSVAASRKIMTFGTEGGLEQAYNDPWVATPNPVGKEFAKVMIYAFAAVAVPAKQTKLASFTCSDFALCDNFGATWSDPAVLSKLGFSLVARGKPSLTQPDYTSQCLAAKQAGAQAIILALDTAAIRRFAGDCARQGYKPRLSTADLLATPSLPSDPNVDGFVVGTKLLPFTSNEPGMARIKQALTRYSPGAEMNGGIAAGWLLGAFFGAAGANLPDNPTPADVVAGLNKVKNNTLGGLTYPITWQAGKPSPRKLCYGVVVIKDRKYTQGPGKALTCV